MTTLYGIKSCDKVKAARRWLEQHDVEYRFHDYREDGLKPAQIKDWLTALGTETLVNRRSTTWRSLSERDKKALESSAAVKMLSQYPTLIKRPLLEHRKRFVVGFNAAEYAAIFGV